MQPGVTSPSAATPPETPAGLQRDVRLLDETLGRVIGEAGGAALLEDVERLRNAATVLRDDPSDDNRRRVLEIVDGLDLAGAEDVARAFTIYFQLINIAEERSRVRYLADESRRRWPLPDSLAAAVDEVRDQEGNDALSLLLSRIEITPVLTAHPTEAKRRAVVETLKTIAEELAVLDDPRISRPEEAEARRRLEEDVAVLWATDQLRGQRPTPLDEVRGILALFDETIFWAAPAIYRELDHALGGEDAGRRPPGFPAFLRWGSWIGGDRDGNPFVTADTTLQAAAVQSEHALRSIEDSVRWLGSALSASADEVAPSPSLLAALEEDAHVFPEAAAALVRWMPDTPHRRMLLLTAERVSATRHREPGSYGSPAELLGELHLVQDSFAQAGAARLAFGELQHLIWQVETFGFHLASLEIRQHSSVHERVIDELAPGAFGDVAALHRLALEGWPSSPDGLSPEAEEVLATLRAMRKIQEAYGANACGRYVVSFTRSAADVVAVRALARLAVPDGSLQVDVVPLFESRADLEAAPAILDELLALPGTEPWLHGRARRLEVMLGYSDSAKEVGMLAANLALYRVQAELTDWAARNDVALTLFHGRGGAVGRGGGPTNRAIFGQAPGSVAGRFKVTEQGEVVFARYANAKVAQRHLEAVAHATILASTASAEAAMTHPRDDVVTTIARASEAAWTALVDTPGFAAFFARATPLEEIESLQIGSRPARRSETRDVASLRAIPWVFAWTQSRCNLPGWFGLGSGLAAVAERDGGVAELRAMYADWPFFTSLIDNAELSLVKADMAIAQLYLAMGERPDIVATIEAEFDRSRSMVLAVTGHDQLLAKEPLVRRDIELRNPYVDALSFLQLRFLRELRAGIGDEERATRVARLVHVTVNGVAAGLQNTG
jgi:phosphoenolpyruvate carboxylase